MSDPLLRLTVKREGDERPTQKPQVPVWTERHKMRVPGTHGCLRWTPYGDDSGWYEGVVATPYGYVWVYAQHDLATYRVIDKYGYEITYTFRGPMRTKKAMATLANKLIKESL